MSDARRRAVMKAGLGLGFGLCLLPRPAPGQEDQASVRPREGDLLVKVGDARATPLTPDDIPSSEAQTIAWAMDPATRIVRSGSRLNQVILIRLGLDTLTPPTKSRSADGIVAYTAICTHTGCEVDEWIREDQLLLCPCHHSTFDPKDGAKVVDGPAPRMLPALPLKIADGKLTVAQPFTSRVGFESGP